MKILFGSFVLLITSFSSAFADSTLFSAAASNDVNTASQLIGAGADIKAVDSNGMTALHICAQYNSVQVAALLISKGADVNASDPNGNSPLGFAARYEQVDVAKILISNGADLHQKTHYGRSPLLMADPNSWRVNQGSVSLERFESLINLLLANGVDINERSFVISGASGYTLLNTVLWEYPQTDVPTIQFLVSVGADVNISAEDGNTAMLGAVQANWMDGVNLLTQLGASINVTNSAGISPLLLSIRNNLNAFHTTLPIFNFLIAHGASANVHPPGHSTGNALNEALNPPSRDLAMAKVLVSKVNSLTDNPYGLTPIQAVSLYFQDSVNEPIAVDIVNLLISGGVDPNSPPVSGDLPVFTRDPNILKILLAHGANANVTNSTGESPLTSAFEYTYSDPHTPLQLATALIQAGANVNFTTSKGTTPLAQVVFACTHRRYNDLDETPYINLARLMLSKGANANMPVTTHWPSLPVNLAWNAIFDFPMFSLLIENGADVSLIDGSTKETLLHIVSGNNLINQVMLLVEHRADVNARDSRNLTPLDETTDAGVKSYLIAHGAVQ